MRIRFKNLHASIYLIRHREKPIYVGQTRMSVKARMRCHLTNRLYGNSRCVLLNDFLEENTDYENYLVEVLEVVPLERSNEREKFWIKAFGSTEKLLNMNIGGNAGGKDHYLYGGHVPRKVVEASVAARIGKPLSAEHKAKLRAAHLGRRQYAYSHRIQCDQTGVIYESILDAATFLGVTKSAVCAHLSGKVKRIGKKYTFTRL